MDRIFHPILFFDIKNLEGGFFGPQSFMILKNSQDLSNEWSKFILNPLEVDQTYVFFEKIHIFAPYNDLTIRHDSEFAKF